MAKFFVDIKEIHDASVTVEAPEGTSREEILQLAQTKFEEEGAESTEYNRTMDRDTWTVKQEEGKYC